MSSIIDSFIFCLFVCLSIWLFYIYHVLLLSPGRAVDEANRCRGRQSDGVWNEHCNSSCRSTQHQSNHQYCCNQCKPFIKSHCASHYIRILSKGLAFSNSKDKIYVIGCCLFSFSFIIQTDLELNCVDRLEVVSLFPPIRVWPVIIISTGLPPAFQVISSLYDRIFSSFPCKVTWRDVAGLDEIISELQDTVILPFQKRHLFCGSKLLQPPKGETWRKHMKSQFYWSVCFPSYFYCTLGLHDKSHFYHDRVCCFN